MTHRFYFDLRKGQANIRDVEGVDANSPDEAIRAAQSVLDEIRGNDELQPQEAGWQLIIRDQKGLTLRVMSLDGGIFHNHGPSRRVAPQPSYQ